jgi:hypothetical protein
MASSWLGDPNLVNYEQFKGRFESDEFSLVLLDAPALWDESFIAAIRQAVAAFKQLEHVTRVVSITNVRNIEGSGDEILIEDFFQGVISARGIADKQQKAVAHPHYSGFYVSKDGHHVAILVETEIIKGQMDYKIGLTKSLRRIAGEGPLAPYNPRVVGAPVLDADVRTMVEKESGMFSVHLFCVNYAGLLGGVSIPLRHADGVCDSGMQPIDDIWLDVGSGLSLHYFDSHRPPTS